MYFIWKEVVIFVFNHSLINYQLISSSGPGTNSISGTDDDDLNDSDLDDDDDDEDVDVDGLDDQDAEGVENAIIDIREPLINLKKKLEAFQGFAFWLIIVLYYYETLLYTDTVLYIHV